MSDKRTQDAKGEKLGLEEALRYLACGWQVVPIPHGEKGPVIKDWPDLRLDEAQIRESFGSGLRNIGVILGAVSGVIDLDLDCDEAIALAPAFLPPTPAVFGRKTRPRSHYIYEIDKAAMHPERFDGTSRETLLELRADGQQTVFPPSIHSSGEEVRWYEQGQPAKVTAEQILVAAKRLAAATLLARHWPREGRHHLALAVSGTLARAGLDKLEIACFMESVCEFAGDEKTRDRVRTAGYAVTRVEADKPAYGLPKIADALGDDVADRLAKWLGLEKGQKKKSPAERDKLFKIASDSEFWHDELDQAYATVEADGHHEHLRIGSRRFRKWLIANSYDDLGKAPSSTALDEAIATLDSRAQRGALHPVFVRVAEFGGKFYIDLCDPLWRAVEVDSTSWRIVTEPPVRFIRSSGMLPLPDPKPGEIRELRRFVNVESEEDFRLFVSLVVSALVPGVPYPIGILVGEQGTAKTTLAKIYRALVDPNVSPTRAMPKSEQDLYVAAMHGWVLSFDNLSGIPAAMADALCRVATGGGFSTRQLYTDLEEVSVHIRRPILLNGIPLSAERPDLLDRSIVLTLPVIDPRNRQPERKFWPAFEEARPRILGALMTALSAGLRNLGKIELHELPRMSDFVEWLTAAEEGLGWPPGSFTAAYNANRSRSMTDVVANDPIVIALTALALKAPVRATATDLLKKLNEQVGDDRRVRYGWPAHPNQLTKMLRRLAPPMRAMGIEVNLDRERDAKNVKLIEVRLTKESSEGPF
jgi:hypothetical protein